MGCPTTLRHAVVGRAVVPLVTIAHNHRSRDFDAAFVVTLREIRLGWRIRTECFVGRTKSCFPALIGRTSRRSGRSWDSCRMKTSNIREQRQMLTMLEDWGVRTPEELRSRWAPFLIFRLPILHRR